MSEWHEAGEEDIEVDEDLKEVNILVTDNEFGNVHLTLTFEQIKDIADQIALT